MSDMFRMLHPDFSVNLLSDWRMVALPYALESLGKRRYVVLNRRYKPLSDPFAMFAKVFVDYGLYSVELADFPIRLQRKLSWEHKTFSEFGDTQRIYLVDSVISPDPEYMDRLTMLCDHMNLKGVQK